MTRTIEIEFPRTLLLENVASVPLQAVDPRDVTSAAARVARFIRDAGARPVGPTIHRVTAVLESDGTQRVRSALMRQADQRLSGVPGVLVESRIEVPNCVLARFRGDAHDVDMVHLKINVFAYENGIELEGTVYLVFAGEDGTSIEVDAFAPTVVREQ